MDRVYWISRKKKNKEVKYQFLWKWGERIIQQRGLVGEDNSGRESDREIVRGQKNFIPT